MPSTTGPGQPPTKIMLLGTFHFEDRGLDDYKPQATFDAGARQNEVLEVVERLAAYNPTKIAVERRFDEQETLNRAYREYVQNALELPGDEVYQLSFRLARRLQHSGLYGVNAWERLYNPPIDMEQLAGGLSAVELNERVSQLPDFRPYEDLETYAAQRGQAHKLTEWTGYYRTLHEQGDVEMTRQTLRETLRRANEPATIVESHGQYLVGAFKIGSRHEYPGADLTTRWYNRNLRIFANLQRVTEPPDERLLLIIGWGHLPILRHCAEASPEYELVEVADYL